MTLDSSDKDTLETTTPLEQERILLLTHPRSCGTCFELYLEQFGYTVVCNPFDRDYYFIQQRGSDAPDSNTSSPEDRFDNVAARVMATRGPIVVRAASYTILPHVGEQYCVDFLESFDHVLTVTRDPAYALPAHRRLLDQKGHELTFEEAGYSAQLEVQRALEGCHVPHDVLDSHAALANPAEAFACLGLPERAHPVQWEPGVRSRWGLWLEWKKAVSTSTCLRPVPDDAEKAARGMSDPLYESCYRCYRQLLDRGSSGREQVEAARHVG
jgi:hypothetical protein